MGYVRGFRCDGCRKLYEIPEFGHVPVGPPGWYAVVEQISPIVPYGSTFCSEACIERFINRNVPASIGERS